MGREPWEDWLTGVLVAGLPSGFNRQLCLCLRWECTKRRLPEPLDTTPPPRHLTKNLLGPLFHEGTGFLRRWPFERSI